MHPLRLRMLEDGCNKRTFEESKKRAKESLQEATLEELFVCSTKSSSSKRLIAPIACRSIDFFAASNVASLSMPSLTNVLMFVTCDGRRALKSWPTR
eukprot:SAG31_NODE_5977_length_2229_cov_1.861502_1_plen_97_part_00